MHFELESMTKVKVLDVRVLSAKDRKPDEPPGAQLLLQATLAADALTMFDGSLKSQFFRKAGSKQGALEGMDGLELSAFAEHVKRLSWDYDQTGCDVEVDHGMGGGRNLSMSDCRVHRVTLSPRQGGSVVVQWTVDAPGLSNSTWALLPNLKSTEIEMTQSGPEVHEDGQTSIEDAKPAKKRPPAIDGTKGHPAAKGATEAFIEQHGTH